MAKNQINVDTLMSEAVRPLYVVAGATDLAVEIARGYVNEAQVKMTGAQKQATERVQRVQSVDLSKEAKARQDRLEKTVADLQVHAKSFPAKVEAYLNDTVADLNETYAELAVRGEKLVAKLRKQQASQDLKAAAKTTTAKAKATRTTATKGAKATKSRAKATGTTAKKAVKSTRTNVKATGTSAQKTAEKATQAVSDGAQKVGS